MKKEFKKMMDMCKKDVILWICLISIIGLSTTSLILPPPGIIDPSVIQIAIILLIFAVVVIVKGIVEDVLTGGGSVEIKHKDHSITVTKDEDNGDTN
jgi:hypothetical protein